MNPIAIRLLNQQLICPQFEQPEDVVEWMGAMQAQEYKMMRWAVEMRLKRPSEHNFRKAFNDGRIIRAHLFRTTWQLVAAEDFYWMLVLCRDKNRRAINGFLKYYGDSISEKEYQQGNELIGLYLSDKDWATQTEVCDYLKQKGVQGTPHHISVLFRRAEIDGVICSGELTDNRENTYSLAEKRVPIYSSFPDKEEALALLARKYFRSHTPATMSDFVWWTGMTTSECKLGVSVISDELAEEHIGGTTYYIYRDCRTRGFRRGVFHLLPPYDEYLIAYKSRHVSLAAEHQHYAHNQNGIFQPVILYDGRVVGNWKQKARECDCKFFVHENAMKNYLLEKEIRRYQSFLNQ
ncbi:MAG: AlkZ family DNA glycosylase [Prevotella sp.]|nr:AlkZ family DNA glycosylase [Prevotella sp.]